MDAGSTRPPNEEQLVALASIVLSDDDTQGVLDQVAAVAASLLDGSLGASVILWDEDTESYRMASTTVPGQHAGTTTDAVRRRAGATRWIIDNAEPLLVTDTHGHPFGNGSLITEYGIRAFAGVPIHSDSGVLGVLFVLDTEPRSFTPSDVAALQILAQRAASAIVSAERVQELRAAAAAHRDAVFRARDDRKRADAVARVANALMHLDSPEDQLPVILDSIGQALGADRVIVVILDHENGSLRTELVGGLEAGRLGPHTYDELMVGLTGWSITNDKTAVSDEPDARESERARDERRRNGSGPLVVVPMQFTDSTSGTLTVIRKQGKSPFTPPEVATVEVMATQLLLALERLRLLEENARLALTDELTGLPNRRRLEQSAAESFEAARRYERTMSVLLIDANEFKTINDTLGHTAGDEVLIHIARACQQVARSADVIGRWGGDEFLAVLPETGRDGGWVMAQRIIDHLDDERVTLSIGIGELEPGDDDAFRIIERADDAMYRAKRSGGNAVA